MTKQEELVIASQFGEGKILADAMTIRRTVFMNEEHVSEKDEIDGQDGCCLHYVSYLNNWHPVSTARIYSIGKDTWHIGRVATLKTFRGRSYARQILKRIEKNAKSKNIKKLELEAQVHAISFYEDLGYQTFGDIFLDANIEHRRMEKLIK
ncbi:GNAT family N-acetyltransferase [Oenococcus sp. UCMA 16435]|nr:GNAT family N-acetyltransferase [Oenococcus sp. UCMA 16435]MDI4584412.1 GNAT family N-acetyltransferase [Oenococcus sp. UCMA 14587]